MGCIRGQGGKWGCREDMGCVGGVGVNWSFIGCTLPWGAVADGRVYIGGGAAGEVEVPEGCECMRDADAGG